MGLCCLPLPDMDTDSVSSERWCAAILMAQHTHVWAPVGRLLSLILSPSRDTESLFSPVLGV